MSAKVAEVIFCGEEASQAVRLFAGRFGEGVFTTMAASGGRLHLWPRHYARLAQHCAALGVEPPKESRLLDEIQPHLQGKARQKVRVLVAANGYGLSFEDLAPPPPEIYRGVAVHFFSSKVNTPAIKSTARAVYEQALREARAHNCFEAILLDESGCMVDGSRTSPLIYDGNNAFSCPQGGIDGVMRREAMDFLRSQGFVIKNRPVKPSEIGGQLLLCNSLLGVVPVGEIASSAVSDLVARFCPDGA